MNDLVLDDRERSNRNIALVCYVLYALTFFTGGFTAIVAVIINAIKLDDVRGTWVETHFRWQMRTFWFSLMWAVLIGVFVVATFGLGLFFVGVLSGALAIWIIYRVVKGWLYLNDRRAMYAAAA